MMGIYRIDGADNKVYIGQALDIEKRWYTHINTLHSGFHPNKNLRADYKLYGIEVFKFSVVKIIDNADELDKEEAAELDRIIALIGKDHVYNSVTVPKCTAARRFPNKKQRSRKPEKLLWNGVEIFV